MALVNQIAAAGEACGTRPAIIDDAGDWFAAQLKAGRFLEAERNLDRQNIVSFMPARLIEIRRNRRLVKERRPLLVR